MHKSVIDLVDHLNAWIDSRENPGQSIIINCDALSPTSDDITIEDMIRAAHKALH